MQRVLELAIDLRERAAEVDDGVQVHGKLPGLGAKLGAALLGLSTLGVDPPNDLLQAAHGAEHRTVGSTPIRSLTTEGIKVLVKRMEDTPDLEIIPNPGAPASAARRHGHPEPGTVTGDVRLER